MKISDLIMVFAVLAGPILAVQVSQFLERRREVKGRKLRLFKVLMATRAAILSPQHVEALNMIDVEFHDRGSKSKEILNTWKAYHDHLCSSTISPDVWATKRVDIFVELLHKMASYLNYEFDKTHIKNTSYSPIGHGEFENDHRIIRKAVVELMTGKISLPMHLTSWPPNEIDPASNTAISTQLLQPHDRQLSKP